MTAVLSVGYSFLMSTVENPQVGQKVIRVYANGKRRPAHVIARASVINGIAYAARIQFDDNQSPRTQSVACTDLETA